MQVIKGSYYVRKPKNYSRKGFICQCDCSVMYNEKNPPIKLDTIKVKYKLKKIENNNLTHKEVYKKNRNTWMASTKYWGEFDKVVELPKLFESLSESEFSVKTSSFERDGVQVPFIYQIEIYNINKYISLKTKQNRKKKLKNILNEN